MSSVFKFTFRRHGAINDTKVKGCRKLMEDEMQKNNKERNKEEYIDVTTVRIRYYVRMLDKLI